jgi:hypothetical protein
MLDHKRRSWHAGMLACWPTVVEHEQHSNQINANATRVPTGKKQILLLLLQLLS